MTNQKYHFETISPEQRTIYAMRRRKSSEDWWNQKAKSLGYDNETRMLIGLYWGKGRSLRQVGDACDMSYQVIAWRMIRRGIDRRPRGGRNNIKKEGIVL